MSFAQAAVDGYIHRAEFRFLRPDDSTRWIESVTEPVFEEELHGPMGAELDKESTASSSNTVEEEEATKKL